MASLINVLSALSIFLNVLLDLSTFEVVVFVCTVSKCDVFTFGNLEELFTMGGSVYAFNFGIFEALTGGGSLAFGIFEFLGGGSSGTLGGSDAAAYECLFLTTSFFSNSFSMLKSSFFSSFICLLKGSFRRSSFGTSDLPVNPLI